MKIIEMMSHITKPLDITDSFYREVNKVIRDMQSEGLEVEVQYQQSNYVVSALILGRKEKEEK